MHDTGCGDPTISSNASASRADDMLGPLCAWASVCVFVVFSSKPPLVSILCSSDDCFLFGIINLLMCCVYYNNMKVNIILSDCEF